MGREGKQHRPHLTGENCRLTKARTDFESEGGRSMVGHDFALTFPFAPGTHGNTNELGWQAGWQTSPRIILCLIRPFPCRRRRCRPI